MWGRVSAAEKMKNSDLGAGGVSTFDSAQTFGGPVDGGGSKRAKKRVVGEAGGGEE